MANVRSIQTDGVPPNKRIKDELTFDEVFPDELLDIADRTGRGAKEPSEEPAVEDGNEKSHSQNTLQDSVKSEVEVTEGKLLLRVVVWTKLQSYMGIAKIRALVAPQLVLRRRSSVQPMNSSGIVRTAENQPAFMTFGDFRKLFGIPSGASG